MDITFCDHHPPHHIKLNDDTKIKIVACEGKHEKKVKNRIL